MIPVFRRQLPAYSPLPLRAVWAGVRGMLGDSGELRSSVSRSLCDTYDARSVLLVGSGTMALRLALSGVRALVSPRPVALPAYSCYDVATAADGADVQVSLYDLDPSTLGPDERSLRRALGAGASAVVAAHLYGYPIQIDRVAEMARDAGSLLIEDAAQGADGTFAGRRLGSFGSLSVLSFGRGKGKTAGGGGALLAHDDRGTAIVAWAERQLESASRGAREAAMLASQWALGRPSSYGLPASLPFLHLGETIYHPPRPPAEMSATALRALGVALMAGDTELTLRRVTAERLLATARKSSRVQVVTSASDSVPGYLRLPLRSAAPHSVVTTAELARHGVAPGYPTALDSLSPFRERVTNRNEPLTGAHILADTLFTLPTHSRVQAIDIAAMEAWLSS